MVAKQYFHTVRICTVWCHCVIDSSVMNGENAYERQRALRIEENRKQLHSLDLLSAVNKITDLRSRQKQVIVKPSYPVVSSIRTRTSTRSSNQIVMASTGKAAAPPAVDDDAGAAAAGNLSKRRLASGWGPFLHPALTRRVLFEFLSTSSILYVSCLTVVDLFPCSCTPQVDRNAYRL